MPTILKNVLTLVFFVIMLNLLSKAEASTDHETLYYQMFYQSLPDSAMVNFGDQEKCCIRYWTYCEVA